VDESAPGSVFSFVERVGFANSCGCLVFVDEFGEEGRGGHVLSCCRFLAGGEAVRSRGFDGRNGVKLRDGRPNREDPRVVADRKEALTALTLQTCACRKFGLIPFGVLGVGGDRLEDVPLAVEFRGGGPGVTVRR
jgi:hypothetical protein